LRVEGFDWAAAPRGFGSSRRSRLTTLNPQPKTLNLPYLRSKN